MARSLGPSRRRRWAVFGSAAALALATLVVARSGPAPLTSGPVAPGAFVLVDSSQTLAARKAAVERALESAAALYEGASAAVQAAAAAYVTANAELPGAQSDLAIATGAEIAAKVNVANANAALVDARNAVVSANATLAQDNARVTAQQAAIADLATSVYQGSAFLGLDSLLTSGPPGDVLDQFDLANELAGDQAKTLDSFLEARQTAKVALNAAGVAVQRAATAQVAAVAALQRSQSAKAVAAKDADTVNALIARRQAALVAAQKNKASVLAQYEQLEHENAVVTAQLKAQAAADRAKSKSGSGTASVPTGRSGYFIMPVHGWKSSDFGMRFDPIYKRWQLHAGVDIAAAGGTPIKAARSGRVIRAGWLGGYGNYTCIDTGLYEGPGTDHGRDIANCYAHQSRILVHVGEVVRTGQEIGLVGETGAATGYHLHFEVRVDGVPVQPLDWLPACFC